MDGKKSQQMPPPVELCIYKFKTTLRTLEMK